MDGAVPPEPDQTPSGIRHRQRVALIVIHGMGDQWRTEDPVGLSSMLDEFQTKEAGGPRLQVTGRQESSLLPDGDRLTLLSVTGLGPPAQDLDIHEVYWAPLSPPTTAATVVRWMRAQVLVPLWRQEAAWHRLPRLRRGVLAQLRYTEEIQPPDAVNLLAAYDAFVSGVQQGKPSAGTFQAFLDSLNDPSLQTAARKWKALSDANDRAATWMVLSLVLMTVVFALLTLEAVAALLKFMQVASITAWTTRYQLDPARPVDVFFSQPMVLLTVVITLAWLLGVRPFFEKYVGDAVQWATYHETSDAYAVRAAVLRRAQGVLAHVFTRTDTTGGLLYDRVVIAAHSLGSVIIHDALLRMQSAELPGSQRLTHLLTYGSPIDKFAYFFEAHQARTPRYEVILDQMRGSLFDPGRSPTFTFEWLNFYEDGDLISGTVHTVGSRGAFPPVENIYTPNAHAPVISPNHTRYPLNKVMISRLWAALTRNNTYVKPSTVLAAEHVRWMRLRLVFLLAVPWALLAAYVCHAAARLNVQAVTLRPQLIFPLGAAGLSAVLMLGYGYWRFNLLLRRLALVILMGLLIAVVALWVSPPVPPPLAPSAEEITSALIGIAVPIVLACACALWLSRFRTKPPLPPHPPSSRLLRWVRYLGGLLLVLVLLSTTPLLPAITNQAPLAWWWWRNTFLFSTLSLLALAAAQVVWGNSTTFAHLMRRRQ